MPTTYPIPVSARLDEAEQEILRRIQAQLARPGLVVTVSDAIKVSLHFWAEHNTDAVSGKENNPPEN